MAPSPAMRTGLEAGKDGARGEAADVGVALAGREKGAQQTADIVTHRSNNMGVAQLEGSCTRAQLPTCTVRDKTKPTLPCHAVLFPAPSPSSCKSHPNQEPLPITT